MSIKPNRININKKRNPEYIYKLLKIKGNENFDANQPINIQSDSNPLNFLPWDKEIKNKRNRLKLVVRAATALEPGFYAIGVGDCFGEVEIYDKKAEKDAKKAAKEAAKIDN